MNVIFKYGVILGVLVVAWTYIMGFTGWYKDLALVNLFWVVILIEIFVLLAALRRSAAMGATYGTQVGVGLGVASVAGLLVFVGSYLFATVAFPDYFEELTAIQAQMLRDQGLSEPDVQERLAAVKGQYTPFGQALQGFIGTVVTGIIVSAIAAVWIRHRPTSPSGTSATA